MIDKQIDFIYGDNNSEVLQLLHPNTLEKNAGLAEDIINFISGLKAKQDKTYALVNALSAGEFYGSNRNGDYFPERSLREYHKTFEVLGHVYKHHINKDPKKSFGKVIYAFYNPKMHRVELILELDNNSASDIIAKLNEGELPKVSMGCRVPYDVCSVCGNKAKNRAQYCEHLLTKMNKILPDGRKVYALNLQPKFFDLSIVTIPADRTAGVLKVIDLNSLEKNAEALDYVNYFAYNNLEKVASLDQTASIKKHVDGQVEVADKNPVKLLKYIKTRIREDKLDKLASYSLSETLSTFLGLRILPTPEDFQKLALYSLGKHDLANELEKNGQVFELPENIEAKVPDDLSLNHFNYKIAELLGEDIPLLSLTKQTILTKALIKEAEFTPQVPQTEPSLLSKLFFSQTPEPAQTPHKNPIVPLGIIGTLYAGYLKVFNKPSVNQFKSFMQKNPWLLPMIVGAGTAGSLWLQNESFNKTAAGNFGAVDKFVRNSFLTLPISYLYAGKAQNKTQSGIPISESENFVRKHPALTGIVASMIGVKGEKSMRKFLKVSEFVSQLPEEALDKYYNSLIN